MRFESVAFIPGSRKKLNKEAPAWRFYQGDRFHDGRMFASNTLKVQHVFALSGKHGLVCMGEQLRPYDEPLAGKEPEQLEWWARRVIRQFIAFATQPPEGELVKKLVLPKRIVVLADDLYADPLRNYLPMAEYPLTGLNKQEQRQMLRGEMSLAA